MLVDTRKMVAHFDYTVDVSTHITLDGEYFTIHIKNLTTKQVCEAAARANLFNWTDELADFIYSQSHSMLDDHTAYCIAKYYSQVILHVAVGNDVTLSRNGYSAIVT